MFIVKIDENFIETARKFSAELMNYKRDETDNRGIYLGDLDPKYCTSEMRCRYNINDHGDIYFINATYANRCMCESWEYKEHSRRESAGFKSKAVLESIKNHHNYDEVKDIVKKYFEIA